MKQTELVRRHLRAYHDFKAALYDLQCQVNQIIGDLHKTLIELEQEKLTANSHNPTENLTD